MWSRFICTMIIISGALCIIYIVKKEKLCQNVIQNAHIALFFFWMQTLGKSCREQQPSLYSAAVLSRGFFFFSFFLSVENFICLLTERLQTEENFWHADLRCSRCIWQINLKTSKPKFNRHICKHSKTMWNHYRLVYNTQRWRRWVFFPLFVRVLLFHMVKTQDICVLEYLFREIQPSSNHRTNPYSQHRTSEMVKGWSKQKCSKVIILCRRKRWWKDKGRD